MRITSGVAILLAAAATNGAAAQARPINASPATVELLTDGPTRTIVLTGPGLNGVRTARVQRNGIAIPGVAAELQRFMEGERREVEEQ